MQKGRTLVLTIATTAALSAPVTGQDIAEHRPVYSRDGERVVFMRQSPETEGDWELFIADATGRHGRRLTRSPGWDGYAVFSPDGETLVFDRGVDAGNDRKQPHLLGLESGHVTPLGPYEGWLSVSDWSPDHGLLAFWEKSGQRDLYLLGEDGSILRRLTDTPGLSEHDAHFSPDGRRIVLASGSADGTGMTTLEVMTSSGAERRTLVESHGRIYGPAWSPDGGTIAYTDAKNGENADVFLVAPADGHADRLTTDPAWDHMPVWSADGSHILFTSYRSGSERMYTLDLASGAIERWEVR